MLVVMGSRTLSQVRSARRAPAAMLVGAWAAVATGCGASGGAVPGAPLSAEAVADVQALPTTTPSALKARVVPASDAVVSLAPLPGGAALLGTAGGPLRLEPPPGGAVGLPLDTVGEDPPETGGINGFAPRWEGTHFLLGARGLFYYDGQLLLYSPVSRGLDGPPVAAAAGEPGDVLLATASTLYWAAGGMFYRITVPGLEGAPRLMARGGAARDITLAAYSHALVALERTGADLRAQRLDRIRPREVRELAAATDGSLAVGTDSGVLVRDPNGRWAHYTLAASGGAGVAALRLAVSTAPDGSAVLYALYPGGLWRLQGGRQALFVVPDADPVAVLSLSADRSGRVYLGRKSDVLQVLTEVLAAGKATFSEQVVPFVDTYCITCHGPRGYAPVRFWRYEEFKMHIDRIIVALETGRMPLGRKLSPPDFEVVKRWKGDGMLP